MNDKYRFRLWLEQSFVYKVDIKMADGSALEKLNDLIRSFLSGIVFFVFQL